ncbi:MAG: helix-turn-helix transcriptional regulator [Clostridia bacterium]|nr:helix-turn-helix transcriptional regulator [Clostridia bacterium]
MAELERLAEITPKTVTKWDEIMPAADKLARVARVLHTTVEELLADPEEPAKEAV